MSDRATRNGKVLSLMIVSLLAVGGLLGFGLAAMPVASADSCGQASTLLTGSWVVTAPQTCSGMMFSLDGNLYIRNGGSLTLINGGISFVQDTGHIHAMFIDTGGSLILDNSTITTATNTLNPYVKLTAMVNGTLAMTQDAVLQFPGALLLDPGSVLNMTASTITGFSDSQLSGLGTSSWIDDNDDSAIITMTTSTARLYRSTIEKIYENTQAGGFAKNITVSSTSALYAYDSYIGVDFSNNWQIHNVMNVDTTSRVFLYNVTVDQAQSDATPQYLQLPAFNPVGSGAVYILRWMNVETTDPYGTPIGNVPVWSHVGSQTGQYPDNANLLVPSSQTLWYMGKSAATFNRTDASGWARIPLWTDTITQTSLPNANSFGNYYATAQYNASVSSTVAASFPTYPSITASDNNIQVAVPLNVPGLTPDLTVSSVVASGGNGQSHFQPLNTAMTITATIHNDNQNPVTNVVVLFFSTNVDTNGDGIMDASVANYYAAGYQIANVTVASVPANGDAVASAPWMFKSSYESSVTISVVVNPPLGDPSGPGAIPETNLRNNIATYPMTLFTWPDLLLTAADVSFPSQPVANNQVPVDVTIHNAGTIGATGATAVMLDNGVQVSNRVTFSVGLGSANIVLNWLPTSPGSHNVTVFVMTSNSTIRNTDYNLTNNAARVEENVVSQPDLAVLSSDYTTLDQVQNRPFSIVVRVYNLGQTAVQNTSVAVYLNGNLSQRLGRTDNVAVIKQTNVTVQLNGIPTPTTAGNPDTLMVVVNPDHILVEGGLGYTNDYANITVNVAPPQGTIVLATPTAGQTFGPTELVSVSGVVRDTTPAQNGIAGLVVTISIIDSGGSVVGTPITATTDSSGLYQATLNLANYNLPDGTYTLQVSSQTGITSQSASIVVKRNVPFLSQPVPLLGIPWWLFLIIIAAVAAIVIGVTVYFKVYGLGKMVECGECGAFIPEDATVCPKCGVEFEKDMAKCSNCQAWIPVDVKQCPECGVEFATGEVEMADYQEKMRLQYDEVVQKFKEDASRQLGRALSDKEFQEWWRKQPTFLTFEDWLREEEEMRKMGSRPCPVCGTLNSVTATVCHKCGSLMKEEKRPPSGGSGGVPPAAKPRAAAPAPAAPPTEPQGGAQAAPGGTEAVPRRVIRKPVAPATVVQKRVIKRPLGEGESAEGTEQQESSDAQNEQGDEL